MHLFYGVYQRTVLRGKLSNERNFTNSEKWVHTWQIIHVEYRVFFRLTTYESLNTFIKRIIFLLHEPEGCNEIASRGWMNNGSKSSRGRSPRDDDPLSIHPRDVISLHPKGSCSRNIVSWFTIYLIKLWGLKSVSNQHPLWLFLGNYSKISWNWWQISVISKKIWKNSWNQLDLRCNGFHP